MNRYFIVFFEIGDGGRGIGGLIMEDGRYPGRGALEEYIRKDARTGNPTRIAITNIQEVTERDFNDFNHN